MSSKKTSVELFNSFIEQRNKRYAIQEKGNRDIEPNLFNASSALDTFYFLEKLKLYCAYLNYKNMRHQTKIRYDETAFKLIQPVQKIIKEGNYHPVILIYWKISQLYKALENANNSKNDAIKLYEEIEEYITQNREIISDDELIEIYSSLTNYAVYQVNQGNELYIIKNIVNNQRIINLQIEDDTPFIINVGVYKNMVSLILKLNHLNFKELSSNTILLNAKTPIEWAEKFVEKYKVHLPIDKQLYYNYSKAFILLKKQKYRAAFEELRTLSGTKEMFINLDVKVLLLQLLLELEIVEDPLLSKYNIYVKDEIEKYRAALKHDRLKQPKLTYHKTYYEGFLNLYRKFYSFFEKNAWMYRFGDETYHEKREHLKQLLKQYNKYSYGKWFLEKLETIK